MASKIFSIFQNIIFHHIGKKIRPGSLKGFMDKTFVIFEKVAFNFEKIANFYLEIYEDMIENELSMLDLPKCKKILVIGSGSLPVTPILIAKKTDADIIGVDIDKKAIKKSLAYIKKIGLENQIKLVLANGLIYPVKDFDAIFMLYGIRQQKEMLSYLSKNMSNSTELIFRTVTDNGKIRIDYDYGDLSEWFKVVNNIKSYGLGEVDSFLLKKKI